MLKYFSSRVNNFCFYKLINRRQINIHNITEKEKMSQRIMHLKHNALQLNDTIAEQMDVIYNADNLTFIATTIEKKTGNFITEDLFPCWCALRVFGPHWW